MVKCHELNKCWLPPFPEVQMKRSYVTGDCPPGLGTDRGQWHGLMEFQPKRGTGIVPWELEEGWVLPAEGIQVGCMEEGALAGLEGWGGFQGKEILPDPNVLRRNSGHHFSSPAPTLSVGRACHPGSPGINPVCAYNLLLCLPQTVPVPSRGQAWLCGPEDTQARAPGPCSFLGSP